MLVPANWSAAKFERKLRRWLDDFSCNDPRNFRVCALPRHVVDCDECEFAHSGKSTHYAIKTPFLQLTEFGTATTGGIQVAVTAVERASAMRIRAGDGGGGSRTHRLAVVFYANLRPKPPAREGDVEPMAVRELAGQLCEGIGVVGKQQRAGTFTAGGGDHTLPACVALCAQQGDGCTHVNFFHDNGFCHLFRTCTVLTDAVDGGVVYTVGGNERRPRWTIRDGRSGGTTLDVGVPVRRIYEGHDRWAGVQGYHTLQMSGGRPIQTGTVDGVQATAWALMPTGAADVLLLSGSSFVSIDGAERNLRNATPDPGSVGSTLDGAFTAMVAHSKASWERRFSAIEIEAEPSTRRLLYTSLYHSMLAPRIYSDADGEYPAFNMHATTARARGWTYFSDFSA